VNDGGYKVTVQGRDPEVAWQNYADPKRPFDPGFSVFLANDPHRRGQHEVA
jgi:hypothetical protein